MKELFSTTQTVDGYDESLHERARLAMGELQAMHPEWMDAGIVWSYRLRMSNQTSTYTIIISDPTKIDWNRLLPKLFWLTICVGILVTLYFAPS